MIDNNNNPTQSFDALISYCIYGINLRSPETNNYLHKLYSFRNSKKLSKDSFSEIFFVIGKYILFSDTDQTPEIMLNQLHAKCRFPIIPLFIWYAIENHKNSGPGDNFPFQMVQCVLPMWRTNELSINIDEKIKSNIMVVLIIGLKPLKELDWTLNTITFKKSRPNKLFKIYNRFFPFHKNEGNDRLHNIFHFYEVLSKPLIDQVFYGDILKERIMIKEKTKIDNIKNRLIKTEPLIGTHSNDNGYYKEICETIFSNNDIHAKSVRLKQIKELINTLHDTYIEINKY